MYLFFLLKNFIITIIQCVINFLSFLTISFDKRPDAILKLCKNLKTFENSTLSRIKRDKKKRIVIFEMFNINENIIAFYLWSKIFKKKGYDCLSYPLKINFPFYNPKTNYIYNKLGFKTLDWKITYNQKIEIDDFLKKLNFEKISKKKFLNFKFRNITIGELIYDHFLRYNFKATCLPNSKDLLVIIKKALERVLFWDEYFKKNDVSCICYSHSPYLLGIPGRVAIKHKIDSLNITGNNVFRFNQKNIYKGDQFKNAKKLLNNFFKKLGKNKSKKLKNKYKRLFKDVMTGKNKNIIGTLSFSQKNTFKKRKNKKLIYDKGKFKVLVSAHDFYEGPNTWGKFIFTDFYEWLNFLSNYIKNDKKKSRHWFIKPHPDGSEDQIEILNNLFKENDNVTILPKKITHSQLIDIKINFVLTARGSITYQYTYFGVNTLICSNIGLYRDFKFLIKSASKNDYIKKLNNMEKLAKKKPNIEDAINYFLMLNIFVWSNDNALIFPDISEHIKNRKIFFGHAKSEKITIDTFKFIEKHLTSNHLNRSFNIMNNFLEDKKQLIMARF